MWSGELVNRRSINPIAPQGMATDSESLALGLQHHRSGNVQEAEQIYRAILQADPNNAEALGLLGAACLGLGRIDEAETHLRQSLRLSPNHAGTLDNLGIALVKQGKLDESVQRFQEAIRLNPNVAETYSNLGNALSRSGKLDEAVVSFREALRLKPNYAEVYNNLAVALTRLGKSDEAVLALTHALRLHPNYAEAYNNLGTALTQLEKLDEAVDAYQQSLRIRPSHGETLSNLGNSLNELGRLDQATEVLERAIRLQPNHAEACLNLGVTLFKQRKPHEAMVRYRQALGIKPDYAAAHRNLGMTLLLVGDYEQGWPEYEWRWRCKDKFAVTPRAFPQPSWDGASASGRTILLHTEQGLGDTLHFIRYAPLVKQRCGTVIVECPRKLHAILGSCPGIDRFVAQGDPLPPFDMHIPLLSLPRVMGTIVSKIPANVPYLFAKPELIDVWRHELSSIAGLRIGINWRGNPENPYERQRRVPLSDFVTLANLPEVRLFSLQKGSGSAEIGSATRRFAITDLAGRLDESTGAFMDTAAVMKNLDLVISADTATAHLAGALGVPVWILIPFAPEWRWLLDRQDSPWYPTARLFRQTRPGDWGDVFECMRVELEALGRMQNANCKLQNSK